MYYIYGLKRLDDREYRYVGLTTRSTSLRLSSHFSGAFKNNSSYPVHRWMRKHGRANIVMNVLEECPEDPDYLDYAEKYWIQSLRDLGHQLLNVTEGGGGLLGCVPWNKGTPMSEDHKESIKVGHLGSSRSEVHKKAISLGVSKYYEENKGITHFDVWQDKYGEDAAIVRAEARRSKASAAMSGCLNPMYGRTGPLAPAYGKVGDKHPMYGKHHTEESKKKISERTKGKPKSEKTRIRMSYANHVRFHSEKLSDTCRWCLGDSLEDVLKDKDISLNGDVG